MLVHIQVRPGCEDAFEALARSLYHLTHGKESDVRRYEYWRGAQPGRYYTLISYDDFNGFLAHQTSPHHEAAGPQLRDVIDTLELEWVDPVVSASPLTPSDMSPLADNASELERSYHDRYAVAVAEWWKERRGS